MIASIALFIMPNSPVFWVVARMLWIMDDTAFTVSIEPFRAFVGDNLPDQKRTDDFAILTFFYRIGCSCRLSPSLYFYQLSGLLAAVALPFLAKHFNRKITHMICLILGALGLASIYFINSPTQLLFSMIGIGFTWASILSMPSAILTGSLPSHKMGY